YCPGPIPAPHWGCYGYCFGPIAGGPTYVSVYNLPPDFNVPDSAGGTDPYRAGPTPASPTPVAADKPKTQPAKPRPEQQGNTLADWIKVLQSRDSRIRGEAAATIARYGAAAKEAIPGLIELLKDRDPFVRVEAAQALGAMGTESVAPLTKALQASS